MDLGDVVLLFLLQTLATWVSLLIIVPLAQKLADFGLPAWGELLWKLAVTAAAYSITLGIVGLVSPWAARFVAIAPLWLLMRMWFDLDWFGLVVIVVGTWLLNTFVAVLLISALM
jgi:hypothetical protein